MSSNPRLSVIIPTYQRLDKLRRVLEDLEHQTLASPAQSPASSPPFDVWVVDDGSPEDPRPALAELRFHYPLTVVRLSNGGPARARNAALEQARGEYVLFLNDDIQLAADLLQTHLDCHGTLGEPAAVLGEFRFTEALRQDLFCRVLEDFGLTHTLQLRSETWYDYHSFWTSNLSVPRAAVDYVGRFDPGFPEPSQDDIDLGLRLERELSMRVFFTARAGCRHDHPHTPAMWQRRNRMVGRNVYRMHLKHGTSDLSALKDGPAFSRSKLEALQTALEARGSAMARLRELVEEALREAGGTAEARLEREVQLEDGRTFLLPRDTELLIAYCLGQLSRYDQHLGLVEAALADLGR